MASTKLPIKFIERENQKMLESDVKKFQKKLIFQTTSQVIVDNSTIFRNYRPTFEFELYDKEVCYVASVVVDTDTPPPGLVKISMADDPFGPWRQIYEGQTPKDTQVVEYMLKGRQYGSYLQIKFLKSGSGGDYVGLRYIYIKGLLRNQITAGSSNNNQRLSKVKTSKDRKTLVNVNRNKKE